MKTVYYTTGYDKKLHETNNIIYLNVGEFINLNEKHYKIVWKLFNATDNIMVYHCNAT
jgi:glutathionylspermidine synthase